MLKEISVEIIRKCPNNCLHCSSESNSSSQEMISFAKFAELIDSAAALELETVCFSGGEPFLHPDIEKMIEYVFSKGLNSYIYTSGIVFDDKGGRIAIPECLLVNLKGKITKLIFNIEASTPMKYDLIMGTKNCFELLKQSIRTANKIGIRTEAHFVPMKLNLDEIESTILLCEQLGIAKISFLRLVLHGRALCNANKIGLTMEETKNVNNILRGLTERSEIGIRLGVPFSGEKNNQKCEAAIGKLNIKYDGFVYPCEVFKNDGGEFLGFKPENIFETDLKSIYENSPYLKAVREYVAGYSQEKDCENCVGQYLLKILPEVGEKSGE